MEHHWHMCAAPVCFCAVQSKALLCLASSLNGTEWALPIESCSFVHNCRGLEDKDVCLLSSFIDTPCGEQSLTQTFSQSFRLEHNRGEQRQINDKSVSCLCIRDLKKGSRSVRALVDTLQICWSWADQVTTRGAKNYSSTPHTVICDHLQCEQGHTVAKIKSASVLLKFNC